MGSQLTKVVFDSEKRKNVEALLFMYDNVCMRVRPKNREAKNVFGYLKGVARLVYSSKFIDGSSLSENGRCYEKVCQRIIEQIKVSVDSDGQIRRSMVARPIFNDLPKSLTYQDILYEKEVLNRRVRYGMLKKAITESHKPSEYLVI